MRDKSESTGRWSKRKLAAFVLLGGSGVFGLSLFFPGVRDQITTQVLGVSAKKPDTTPPAVAVTFPANGGAYRAATWNGCLPVGICGTASDATGAKTVEVKLGSGPWVSASGTTRWSLPLSLPTPDGTYAVSVRASDTVTVANTSSPVTVTFRVDTGAPPAPTISSGPEDPTIATTAQFVFADTEAGVTFECRLDGAAKSCVSPFDHKKISVGDHTFSVVAIDGAGNRSPAATWSWTALINKGFGISGNAIGPLLPGLDATPLNLRISNPYNFSIRVLTVEVTVQSASSEDCDVEDSFEHTTQPFTLTTPLVISANSVVFLRNLHPNDWPTDWPAIAMWNNPTVNQDACQDATFTLSYTGTATKS